MIYRTICFYLMCGSRYGCWYRHTTRFSSRLIITFLRRLYSPSCPLFFENGQKPNKYRFWTKINHVEKLFTWQTSDVFCLNLRAGIHDAWWLRGWDFCGYLLLSLLLIDTNDSLYVIALANGERSLYPIRCLAKRGQSEAMLTPNYFSIFCSLM